MIQECILTLVVLLEGNPMKELIGFERVFLEPGQNTTVSFAVTPHDVSYVDMRGKRVVHSTTRTICIGNVVTTVTVN